MSSWHDPARLLERAVESRAFPAAVVNVGRHDRVLWRAAFGRLTYAPDAPVTSLETVFDLASLTKVIATVPLVMDAVEAGTLALDDRVADRLPAWRGRDREEVTIADLLEHASGLTAYLPFFRDHHGRADFERAICTLPLEYAPRTRSIYSDLGFMLLAFMLEDINRIPFAQQFDRTFRVKADTAEVDGGSSRTDGGFSAAPGPPTAGFPSESSSVRLQSDSPSESSVRLQAGSPSESSSFRLQAEGGDGLELLFNPPRAIRDRCAPTELDLWRGRLLQGEVHDENAWALGGASGHAGLFGTAASVGAFARVILRGLLSATETRGAGGSRTAPARGTLERFARKSLVPGSSRALGWDTMLPTSSCGTRLSPRAIGHTGFTGTSLWIDPAQDLYVVLLTNRVHPVRDNNRIQPVRRAIHDAVVASVGVRSS